MRKKVTVVGGGFVGSTTAQRIVDKELADVVLTDILDGRQRQGAGHDGVRANHTKRFTGDGNFYCQWRLQRNGG